MKFVTLSNIPVCILHANSAASTRHSKWGKKLLLYLTINILNTHEISLYLLVTLKTTNTYVTFSMQVLVDSRATGIFISCSFVEKHYMNTHKLSKLIPVFNIDGTLNENSYISKVVNVVLCYQSYFKWALCIVSSLDK